MKVCDKTCIFCFFRIINKYLCTAKRSLISERSSYIFEFRNLFTKWAILDYKTNNARAPVSE